MQQRFRLKQNRQFRYVYTRGRGFAAREISVIYVKGKQLLVGFSVSKKVGNAVVRNHMKRRLRECFRRFIPALKPGSYIITARAGITDVGFSSLLKSMRYLLKKHDAFTQESHVS